MFACFVIGALLAPPDDCMPLRSRSDGTIAPVNTRAGTLVNNPALASQSGVMFRSSSRSR